MKLFSWAPCFHKRTSAWASNLAFDFISSVPNFKLNSIWDLSTTMETSKMRRIGQIMASHIKYLRRRCRARARAFYSFGESSAREQKRAGIVPRYSVYLKPTWLAWINATSYHASPSTGTKYFWRLPRFRTIDREEIFIKALRRVPSIRSCGREVG